jgi:hypothetical protein
MPLAALKRGVVCGPTNVEAAAGPRGRLTELQALAVAHLTLHARVPGSLRTSTRIDIEA